MCSFLAELYYLLLKEEINAYSDLDNDPLFFKSFIGEEPQ